MRYACDVLEELRKLIDKGTAKSIKRTGPGLVEELQTMYTRMEQGISTKKQIISLRNERKELEAEIAELTEYRDGLKGQIDLEAKIKELKALRDAGEKKYNPGKPEKKSNNKRHSWDW